MKLTIVKEDNLVVIENNSMHFDLSNYEFPKYFWAIQWNHNGGEIEFTHDSKIDNEYINKLPEWTKPIIEEHQRLRKIQEQDERISNKKIIFIENGFIRFQRIQRKKQIKQQK